MDLKMINVVLKMHQGDTIWKGALTEFAKAFYMVISK